MGHWIAEEDRQLHVGSLQRVDRQLVILLRLARHVEDGGPVDEHTLVLYLKLPVHVKPLWHFEPVLDGDVVGLVELGLAVDVERLGHRGRIGSSD